MIDPGKRYIGIDKDEYGGMTPNGIIVRDAWVFEIIPETETCAGWTVGQFQVLYDQVADAWQPYGRMVSNLPPKLAERHRRIHDTAIKRARELGWNPSLEDES